MSDLQARALIAEGDLVIIYFSKEQLVPVVVERGKEATSRYGHYKHDDMIDTPYGSKVTSKQGKGFAYLLRPTPELWTLSLPHRTQILYMPDIAFITSYLDIKPGSKVIEAGTGSGSFSHAVARTVGRAGTLYSYEFHEERYKQARDEFHQHRLEQIVIQHRNVCKSGFTEETNDSIDAIFLDLPAPWEAVGAAVKALKKDRPSRICCFSPCIEQVLRTVTALGAAGFSEITMYEALVKNHDHVVHAEPPPTIFDAMKRIKSVEEHKEYRRLKQMERAKALKEQGGQQANAMDVEDSEDTSSKRPREDTEATQDEEEEQRAGKKQELDSGTSEAAAPAQNSSRPSEKVARPQANTRTRITKGEALPEGAHVFSRVLPQARGHTSYLTFATLLPIPSASVATNTATTTAAAAAAAAATEEAQKDSAASTATPNAQAGNSTAEAGATEQPPAKAGLSKEETEALVEGVSFGTPTEL